MRRILVLFIYLILTHTQAQNLLVIYERQINFSRSKYFLFINDTVSYWQHDENLKILDTVITVNNKKVSTSNIIRIETPEYKAFPYKNFVLKNKKTKTVYFVDHGIPDGDSPFIFGTDSLYPMKWTPVPDRKFVLGYICQGAKTTFRGRTYIAYYAPELPYSDGPWKFGGLPGLILAVEDKSGEFHWEALEIIKNYQGVPLMPKPTEFHYHPWNEYVKILRAYRDKQYKEAVARHIRKGISGGGVRIIDEEILHRVYSFEGEKYPVLDKPDTSNNRDKEKKHKKRKISFFKRLFKKKSAKTN